MQWGRGHQGQGAPGGQGSQSMGAGAQRGGRLGAWGTGWGGTELRSRLALLQELARTHTGLLVSQVTELGRRPQYCPLPPSRLPSDWLAQWSAGTRVPSSVGPGCDPPRWPARRPDGTPVSEEEASPHGLVAPRTQ